MSRPAPTSAAVLALPTAAPVPVVQRRRHGPLPKTVRSLSAYRAERNKTPEERDAENVAQVKLQFFNVLDRVLRGDLTGVAIIESSTKGTNQIVVAGDFEEDLPYLQTVLGEVVAAVPKWIDNRQSRIQGP